MLAETIQLLGDGFAVALTPKMLAYSAAGAVIGTAVGVLPGIGSAGALALMIPVLYTFDPIGSIIMLAATYTGVMYGGSTASILLRTPGDTSAVIACLDGHEMARQGRAGPALCIAAIAGFIAGTLAVVGLMLIGPLLARQALAFGAPEYFALMLFGLTAVSGLAGSSLTKGLIACVLGLMLSTVGTDIAGVPRFIFGMNDLRNGIEFLALVMGLFALSEVLINSRNVRMGTAIKPIAYRIYISLKEIRESLGAIFRGGVSGFFVGVLPGAGAGIATFISYGIETQVAKNRENFGKGDIRGLAGPEAANNAASAGSFVPMLSLGIPGSATTAVMLSAFFMFQINPGPLLFTQRPDVVWTLIAALYVGNVMLLMLNLPLIGLFVRILYVPMRMLIPIIVVIAITGIYSRNQAVLDLMLFCAFGGIGFYMQRFGFPLPPIILGFVLGGRLEETFRQSMMMNQGNILAILERPMVMFFIALAVLALVLPPLLGRKRRRAVGAG